MTAWMAVTDRASPVKNFFAIRVAKLGIDPEQLDWRQFPQDLFGEALRKGEVDAIADGGHFPCGH